MQNITSLFPYRGCQCDSFITNYWDTTSYLRKSYISLQRLTLTSHQQNVRGYSGPSWLPYFVTSRQCISCCRSCWWCRCNQYLMSFLSPAAFCIARLWSLEMSVNSAFPPTPPQITHRGKHEGPSFCCAAHNRSHLSSLEEEQAIWSPGWLSTISSVKYMDNVWRLKDAL